MLSAYLYGHNRRLVNFLQVLLNSFKSQATNLSVFCVIERRNKRKILDKKESKEERNE